MENCLVTLIYIGACERECCKDSCVELTRDKEEKQNIISTQKNPTKTIVNLFTSRNPPI